MPLPHPCALVAALLLLCAVPLHAQHDDRIWGSVLTRDGEVHEGFIHLVGWPAAASWADVLAVRKEIPEEHYQDWLDATRGGEPYARVLELKGHRVSWEEKHPTFVGASRAGVRFGHLAELIFEEEGLWWATFRARRATGSGPGDRATRRSRGDVQLATTWVDGPDVRVDTGDRYVEVKGRDIRLIEFGSVPAERVPTSLRLYGTVEDRTGRSFTGFVTWDRRQVFESHVLGGYWEDVPELANFWESDDYERSFRFSQIRSLERTPCFARVTLKSDSAIELCSEPFDDPRPVRISDPALGLVAVEWDAVRILRFEPSPDLPGYDHFDGGRPLHGTVVTREGEEITGRIRWDADKEWSWELLQGSSDKVVFSIEFGNVAHIAREESEGARVMLRDGRSFHLTDGNDVDRDNRGIFIFSTAAEEAATRAVADPAEGAAVGEPVPEWRYVAWKDFREVRFHAAKAREPGS